RNISPNWLIDLRVIPISSTLSLCSILWQEPVTTFMACFDMFSIGADIFLSKMKIIASSATVNIDEEINDVIESIPSNQFAIIKSGSKDDK
ncbi:hypothetical protein, partial [Escherichia coli]|uniref:hypothetical protein n=3 Tax=Bacteria TaxID=2 RepID=UPI00203FD2A4